MADPLCALTDEDLARLVDGELQGDELASAERHVSSCARCREKRRAHERANELLRALTVPSPRSAEWAALLDRAREPVIRWRQLAAAAIAAVLIPLALSVLVHHPGAVREPAGHGESCRCDLAGPALEETL